MSQLDSRPVRNAGDTDQRVLMRFWFITETIKKALSKGCDVVEFLPKGGWTMSVRMWQDQPLMVETWDGNVLAAQAHRDRLMFEHRAKLRAARKEG